MDLTLCGTSAFRYYRIPPQILALYPALAIQSCDSNYVKFRQQPFIEDLLRTPLHRVAFDRRQRASRKLFSSHLLLQEPPPGSFRQTEHGFSVTSPEMTLLTLTRSVSRIKLLMMMFELCGSFAVFKPCDRTQNLLDDATRRNLIPKNEGWQRSISSIEGSLSNLWKRDPLLCPAGIESFAHHASGLRGVKALRWAAARMTGVTASPFEAEASILLSLPREEGGLGLHIENNVRIPLSDAAQALHGRQCCYADILLESSTDSMGVIFECQGRSVHDSEAAGLSDSDRATALASMGYDVILVTHDQIKHERSFTELAKLLCKKMGIPYEPKRLEERTAETELRRNLFIDWEQLVG